MRPSSPSPEPDDARAVRERIIGLGSGSASKSYYPQLKEKIRDLEAKQLELMDTVRTLEERESELERLVDEKEALLKEVHHRVKNNFQVIGSLLNLGLGLAGSNEEAAAFAKTKRRIDTMAMVYGQLLAAESFAELELCSLVRNVVNALFYEAELRDVELSYDLSCLDLHLSVERAIPLALILAEAASNALEHAFPTGGGKLAVRLGFANDAPGTIRLAVEDDGPGPRSGGLPEPDSSLGLTLIEALAAQLKALWRYERRGEGPGLRFVLELRP